MSRVTQLLSDRAGEPGHPDSRALFLFFFFKVRFIKVYFIYSKITLFKVVQWMSFDMFTVLHLRYRLSDYIDYQTPRSSFVSLWSQSPGSTLSPRTQVLQYHTLNKSKPNWLCKVFTVSRE